MNRNNISVGLNTLGDESLLPWKIMNFPIDFPTVKASGKHQQVVVAVETSLHHAWKITALPACFVDTNAHWLQSGEVKQQVVD